MTGHAQVVPPPVARWRSWWAPADPALLHAGSEGERVVAAVRIVVAVVMLYVPLLVMLGGGLQRANQTAAIASFGCLLFAVLMYRLTRAEQPDPRLPFVSSLADVGIVSLTHVAYLLQDMPSVAANSRTTFPAYLIAIGATCLRWDRRITVLAGASAIVQYLLIAVLAHAGWDTARPDDILMHGSFEWGHQFGRAAVLAIFTMLCVAIVTQSSALRLASTRDALTGLKNRLYFDERVAEARAQAARNGGLLAVALVDLDHFKRVNDTHGHEVGDRALKAVAGLLARGVREGDVVARWGGEEFAILLSDADVDAAWRRVDALRDQVAQRPLDLPDGGLLPLTVSAGVARARAGEPTHEWLRRADRALYAAKQAGRNRALVADGDRPPVIDRTLRVG